ncbi:MAG: hypothetical protein WLagBPW_01830 [Shewanella algae]
MKNNRCEKETLVWGKGDFLTECANLTLARHLGFWLFVNYLCCLFRKKAHLSGPGCMSGAVLNGYLVS